jgi:hypothetical protein
LVGDADINRGVVAIGCKGKKGSRHSASITLDCNHISYQRWTKVILHNSSKMPTFALWTKQISGWFV